MYINNNGFNGDLMCPSCLLLDDLNSPLFCMDIMVMTEFLVKCVYIIMPNAPVWSQLRKPDMGAL